MWAKSLPLCFALSCLAPPSKAENTIEILDFFLHGCEHLFQAEKLVIGEPLFYGFRLQVPVQVSLGTAGNSWLIGAKTVATDTVQCKSRGQ